MRGRTMKGKGGKSTNIGIIIVIVTVVNMRIEGEVISKGRGTADADRTMKIGIVIVTDGGRGVLEQDDDACDTAATITIKAGEY